MENEFKKRLEKNPKIAAVKNNGNIDAAIASKCEIVFLLSGSISDLKNTIARLKDAGKMVFVHVDLIEGLGRDHAAINYIQQEWKPDGIISTKNQLLRYAKEKGLLTIQRFFLLDSISLAQCLKIAQESKPTAIEIMPGVMPQITAEISEKLSSVAGVIVGGLVREEKDITNALEAGALGVSASGVELW